MAEIDVLLSSSLKRVAQPGDPAGVADAIRSRVDAGDTGTPASSSGFGGGGPLSWLPWIGVIAVAGIVGGTMGATGVFGEEAAPPPPSPAGISSYIDGHVDGLACPGGAVIGSLDPGQRVYAVERSDDTAYLSVRDPYDLTRTVW